MIVFVQGEFFLPVYYLSNKLFVPKFFNEEVLTNTAESVFWALSCWWI